MSDETISRSAARLNSGAWIGAERAAYAEAEKWAGGDDPRGPVAELVAAGKTEEALDFVRQYLHRAQVLGVENPGGLQALGKAAVTLLQVFESAGQHFGPLPRPGVPSGTLEEWVR